MSRFHWARLIFLAIVAGVGMAGCGSGLFNTEPFADAKKDDQGNVLLRDTPRMWQDWQQEVNRAIESESAGDRPGGGIESWNAQWLRVIDANSDRENATKYIAYIIERRHRAGLPDLEGYSPALARDSHQKN